MKKEDKTKWKKDMKELRVNKEKWVGICLVEGKEGLTPLILKFDNGRTR